MLENESTQSLLNLENLRKKAGLTISELHKITGTSRTTFYNMKKGVAIKEETLIQIALKMRSSEKCQSIYIDLDQFLATYNAKALLNIDNVSFRKFSNTATQMMTSNAYVSEGEYRQLITVCEDLIKYFQKCIEERRKMDRDY